MRKTILYVIALLLLTACKEKDLSVSSEVSPSGLPYTLISMPGNSRVSFQIAWPNRWIVQEGKNQLVPRIGADLILAGGAVGYNAGQVIEEFSDMNSEGFLSVEPDYVIGTLHYSPEFEEQTLKIANAHLYAPKLDERWFRRIQDQMVASSIEAAGAPGALGFEALRINVLGDQSVRMALESSNPKRFENVTIAEVREWVETVIVRNGATIVIAGDLDNQAADKAVDSLFESIPDGIASAPQTITANYEPKRILFHDPSSTTSRLSFIGPLPPTRNGGEFEDAILFSQLRSIDGVLFNAVRTKLRASYDYSAGVDAFSRSNRFLILTGEVESGKISAAEKLVRQAYASFLTTNTIPDIDVFKADFSENLKFMAEDTGSIAFSALLAKLDGFEASKTLELLDDLESVSVQSVNKRRSTAFPKESELVMIVSSPDSLAISDACVIENPEDVEAC